MQWLMDHGLLLVLGEARGHKLSHICFVDDLILVVEATTLQVSTIKGILMHSIRSRDKK